MDLSVVPTIGFDLLYAFVVVRLDRRELMWINVTANPTGRPAMIAEAKIRIRIASTSMLSIRDVEARPGHRQRPPRRRKPYNRDQGNRLP
jgi:hypothetical protein